jgi:hypothetical protein
MGVGGARRWWAAAAVVLSASSAGAQPEPPASPPGVTFEERLFAGVGLVHDNDNLPHPGNTLRDDNYSAAYELRVNGRVVEVLGLTAPLSALDWLTRATRLHARGQRRFHSLQAIGIIYTPDRIQSAEVQTDDRPYASLMALTVARTSVLGAALDREWSTSFSVGMLGLELPGEAQRLLHRTRRWMTGNAVPVDPRGWGNQISAGGEPTALYRAGYRQRLGGDGGAGRRKHWEVLGAMAGEAGYSVSASAEVAVRVGAFTSEFWEFPRGVGGAAVGQQAPVDAGERRWDLLAFAVIRPRAVAYDALLQGQFRRSVFTVPVRHGLLEWEGGVGGSIPIGSHQLQVVVQIAQGRTADYVGPKARDYTWGTVGLFLTNRGVSRR